MTDVFRLKAILPKSLNIKDIEKEITKELRGEGSDLEKEANKSVGTWESDKPSFTPKITTSSNEASVFVGPSGSEKAVKKWFFLNGGTGIRWALMSRDWKSKTKPGSMRSGRGSGRVVIAGRRAMQARGIAPRPGIKERGWVDIMGKQSMRRFPKRIGLAIKRAKKF